MISRFAILALILSSFFGAQTLAGAERLAQPGSDTRRYLQESACPQCGTRFTDRSDQLSHPTRDSENVSVVGQWSEGPCYGAIATGSIAYFGIGANLEIMNFSNPAEPQPMGTVTLSGLINDIAKNGEMLYIACQNQGMRILDVFGPHLPYQVGSLDTDGGIYEIAIAGSYAYIADGMDGLRIVDVSDPANPIQVGWHNIVGISRGVAVSGDLAYIGAGAHGLKVIDVSDPTAPVQIGNYQPGGDWYAQHVVLMDQFALVASGSNGLTVFDISDPTTPTPVASCATPGYAWRLALQGSHLYVADNEGGLRVIDVSDPLAPFETGSATTPEWTENVALDGDFAYVCEGSAGLAVFDITNPSNPTEVGLYQTGGFTFRMTVAENYAFAGGDNLCAVDISDLEAPIMIGSIPGLDFCWDITKRDDYLYVADNDAGLRIVDVSDPANPVETSVWDTPGHATRIALKEDYAFIGDSWGGLRVIDITDPAAPFEAGFADFGDAAQTICLRDNYAFIGGHTFVVYDISDPTDPVQIASVPPAGYCQQDMVLIGNLAYVIGMEGYLQVIDISDPTLPVEIAVFQAANSGAALAIEDGLAYIACMGAGLKVVDITDPQNMQINGFFDIIATDVAIRDGNVYLAAGDTGFWIVRYEQPAAAPDSRELSNYSVWPNPLNPFNPSTTITYTLPQAEMVDLRIFDASGRLIRTLIGDDLLEAGRHETLWSGRDDTGRAVETGVYFARLKTPSIMATRRIMLSR